MFGQLLLYSFERAGKALEESGDDACVEPPVSIPNTAVKHARAESTWLETAWEDRKLLIEAKAHLRVCLFLCIVSYPPRGPGKQGNKSRAS